MRESREAHVQTYLFEEKKNSWDYWYYAVFNPFNLVHKCQFPVNFFVSCNFFYVLFTVVGNFKQRNISKTINFFYMGYRTKYVTFWPYDRNPWYTGPNHPSHNSVCLVISRSVKKIQSLILEKFSYSVLRGLYRILNQISSMILKLQRFM